MAQALNLGGPSRFALLKIEDDDDDDGFAPGGNRSQNKKPGNAQGKTKFVPFGGKATNTNLQKPKKKNGKKHKPVEFGGDSKEFDDEESEEQKQLEETLRISQMTHEMEEERRRSLEVDEEEVTKKAIEESMKNQTAQGDVTSKRSQTGAKANATASSALPAPNRREKTESKGEEVDESEEVDNSPIALFTKGVGEEAKKIMASSKQNRPAADNALAALYKVNFEEIAVVAKRQEREIEEMKAEMVKLKVRAKKVYEVLGEAEMQDKAKLIVDKEKLAKLNEELMHQITDVHTELEQARSRIRELEHEHKKAKSGR